MTDAQDDPPAEDLTPEPPSPADVVSDATARHHEEVVMPSRELEDEEPPFTGHQS